MLFSILVKPCASHSASHSESGVCLVPGLEGTLVRVLIAAELEFQKILVPRLPQHTSNVNAEYVEKSEWSKQLYYLYGTSFLQH